MFVQPRACSLSSFFSLHLGQNVNNAEGKRNTPAYHVYPVGSNVFLSNPLNGYSPFSLYMCNSGMFVHC